ncbi:MAG: sigma-70 family RNA polymerase sigma factor [Chloroflexi bacterium]|nr:sigma-70 family RNA polymerase sigma factor [Chloroflexota bacterium]
MNNQWSDTELLAALRCREEAAFVYLFETYSDRLFRLAAGLLEDEEEAEGVVQETFLRLFERLEQFEGRSSLSTWLYRVAYNKSIDMLRRRRVTLSLDGTMDDEAMVAPAILADWSEAPEKLVSQAEMTAELDRAMAALPDIYRVVFLLREMEGLTTEETAVITHLSISAVKVRLHRARLFLRERLAESYAALA